MEDVAIAVDEEFVTILVAGKIFVTLVAIATSVIPFLDKIMKRREKKENKELEKQWNGRIKRRRRDDMLSMDEEFLERPQGKSLEMSIESGSLDKVGPYGSEPVLRSMKSVSRDKSGPNGRNSGQKSITGSRKIGWVEAFPHSRHA